MFQTIHFSIVFLVYTQFKYQNCSISNNSFWYKYEILFNTVKYKNSYFETIQFSIITV